MTNTTTTYSVLTIKDKLDIVNSHIKNKEYAIYNDEIDLLEENSAAEPNQAVVTLITNRAADNRAKLLALHAEVDSLNNALSVASTGMPVTSGFSTNA